MDKQLVTMGWSQLFFAILFLAPFPAVQAATKGQSCTLNECGFIPGPDGSWRTCKPCPDGVAGVYEEANCDKTKRPVLLVHGTAGTSDNWSGLTSLLVANGYCREWIRPIIWDGIGLFGNAQRPISEAANEILSTPGVVAEGHSRIDISGHSRGGGQIKTWVNRNPDKVAHAAVIGSPGGRINGISCVNLLGEKDSIVGRGSISGCPTVSLPNLGHLSVQSSTQAATAIYRFFNQEDPVITNHMRMATHPVVYQGFAVQFGHNYPMPGLVVDVYAIPHFSDKKRPEGHPLSPENRIPIGSFYEGHGYDSDTGKANVTIPQKYASSSYNLEFHMKWPGSNDQIHSRHLYTTGMPHSDPSFSWLFRANQSDANRASNSADRGAHVIYTVRSQLGDFNHRAGDRLKVNECSAQASVLDDSNDVAGVFIFDHSGDQIGRGESISDYTRSFMIRGADCYIAANDKNGPDQWVKVEAEQVLDSTFPEKRTLWIPNWRSDTAAGQLLWIR